MARKWFQLVGEDGNALTSADAVVVDIEDVAAFRKAVKGECPNALANVDAADLTVFENRAKYDAKEALEEDSPIGSFGGSMTDALIVVVPDADDEDEDYKPFYLSLLQYFMPSSRSLEKIQKTKKDV
ncbi:Crinkler (CRN) family protein [Phytophthora palmivora]|uniref:Crinkler (CRN) family protein n=1 Tax=Phytophthora palmivora TaxID=4796 RepID=A0A2P4X5I5_9STRA|nr:Crinkler (CRN) family protein [Phytophthora palmivora]